MNAIYATSWKKEGLDFPLIWSEEKSSVAAVDVTSRYVQKLTSVESSVGIRLFKGNLRIVSNGSMVDGSGKIISKFETKAGTADLNDLAKIVVKPGAQYRMRFEIDGKTLESALFTAIPGETTQEIRVSDLQLLQTP